MSWMRHILPLSLLLGGTIGVAACLEGGVDFGPPNNLRLRGEVQIEQCTIPEMAGTRCPDWTTEVFPLFDEKYNCALSGCHLAPNDPTGVNMVKGDAIATHAALSAFDRDGRAYISDVDPTNAYLMCNIDPTQPVLIGSFMPRGQVIDDDDLTTIYDWVACGMKVTGGDPVATGGGGGTGGTGGAGGGGGAGGEGGGSGGNGGA
ncbi:MAG: hypothetical protein AAF715_01245 [Myxococcota bacterium]